MRVICPRPNTMTGSQAVALMVLQSASVMRGSAHFTSAQWSRERTS
jgi:hypothetical protein